LFLGREWERKGGAIAVETTIALNEMGLKTELIIVGTQPDSKVPSECVTVVGFLDKNKKQERAQLEQLLKDCHFMHVPTRGDAFSLAFCEASAFGLPVISTATGGVPDVVANGINGQLLPLEARGPDYAKVILDLFSDREAYENLVMSSRKAYDENFNWGAWGDIVRPRVMDLLRSR
jgi:glycosyltransferase involved in cell wall biosynthesis